ncbi:hypothetical protein LCGC14_2843330 [marine sediment metagenome]|uniref:Uncharacterized protein n=1 Tax=marine sediment metagenome TaxID=412755 RepID=A0A0F8YAM8_9ZZZZ
MPLLSRKAPKEMSKEDQQQADDYYNNVWKKQEIYWKIERIERLSHVVGFDMIDITEYIKENDTISIKIYPNRYHYECRDSIYSSQWDGSNFPYILCENDTYKQYLPQLIWS